MRLAVEPGDNGAGALGRRLWDACHAADSDEVETLLGIGADPSLSGSEREDGIDCLMIGIDSGLESELIDRLRSLCDPWRRDANGESSIHRALSCRMDWALEELKAAPGRLDAGGCSIELLKAACFGRFSGAISHLLSSHRSGLAGHGVFETAASSLLAKGLSGAPAKGALFGGRFEVQMAAARQKELGLFEESFFELLLGLDVDCRFALDVLDQAGSLRAWGAPLSERSIRALEVAKGCVARREALLLEQAAGSGEASAKDGRL